MSTAVFIRAPILSSEVYRARDTQLDRDVALKILPDTFSHRIPSGSQRFEREATTLAALNHPNIVHVHGLERVGVTRTLLMELLQGEDLTARIGRGLLALPDQLPRHARRCRRPHPLRRRAHVAMDRVDAGAMESARRVVREINE